ncbi:PEP-CTERM sorting domain-containing protein [Pseudoduganella armeniaca]|uniref:Ice-binding protein C-terminal domain-containing protein n=1 Tax=Pseudoduganella armeniaca TaxID=2072590 RepID=A0A2R4C5P0_9BURK|nr:PEP-CTERM sorting domain-containing protein [Pseudoduganella armeniaca]AVR94947.1 hypothetical protein C9I28_03870 [Pseudoduganella armeniaca]
MMKKLLCAVALCTVATAASAQTDREYRNFRYTGFFNALTQKFEASTELGGSFQGTDYDANGILERFELEYFWWRDDRFEYYDIDYWYCGSVVGCILNQFSYDLRSGELKFDAATSVSDEVSSYSYQTVSGEYFQRDHGYSRKLLWTPETRFEISSSPLPPSIPIIPPVTPPVPEPTTAWMLGAGLVAVGFAARRRRQD